MSNLLSSYKEFEKRRPSREIVEEVEQKTRLIVRILVDTIDNDMDWFVGEGLQQGLKVQNRLGILQVPVVACANLLDKGRHPMVCCPKKVSAPLFAVFVDDLRDDRLDCISGMIPRSLELCCRAVEPCHGPSLSGPETLGNEHLGDVPGENALSRASWGVDAQPVVIRRLKP